jgi:hypothetical protein
MNGPSKKGNPSASLGLLRSGVMGGTSSMKVVPPKVPWGRKGGERHTSGDTHFSFF